jgi:hypothetical protein
VKNLILTELKLRSADWANISDRYFDRDGVTITRGKVGEGIASPSQLNMTLDNRSGDLSPRNPNSKIAGLFGKNTPIRVSVAKGKYGMVLSGSNGRAFMADSVATSITGDIDIRVDMELLGTQQWNTGLFEIASKYEFFVNWLSWSLYTLPAGVLAFAWFPTGTTPAVVAQSTVGLAAGQDRRALRVTLDVDNGAAGNTTTFYTGPTLAGPWTPLGAPIVKAGVTSIFGGDSGIRIGSSPASTSNSWGNSANAVVYGAEIRAGINGTVVASPVFTAQPLDPVPFGVSAFADAQGNSWIFDGTPDAARIWYGDVWTRAVDEIAQLPPRWDESHKDKYVPVTANGILRRLGQGTSPVKTGLRDYILQPDLTDALAFYSPLEGAEGTKYSLNLAPLHYYLQTKFYGFNNPVFTYGKDMGASWIGQGMELNATGNDRRMLWDPATADQNVAVDFVWSSPSLGVLTLQIEDYSSMLWAVTLDTPTNDGTLQVSFTDPAVGPIGFAVQGPFPELSDTALHHFRFQLTKAGADTQFAVYIDGTLRSSGTMTAYVLNGYARSSLFYSRYAEVGQTVMNIAHITSWANASAAQIPPIADVVAAAFGYAGETAGARIQRLCDEGNIPIKIIGDPALTTIMGPQTADPRLVGIRDAEATDFGILTERRDDTGLLYRTRVSQYAQTPAVTIDYSARVVAPPFEPTDDDANTRNRVTASRKDGGSFEVALTTGAMSTQDPPFGIGEYEDQITVNVQTDAQLQGAASWWMRLGSLDAARFPQVTFNLAAAEIQSNPTLLAAILALDVGDRMPVANIDAADIPDDVDLIIQGYSETFDNTSWTITFNCAPGQPYDVAKFNNARYDADGAVLTATITTTATTMQSTSNGSTRWTLDPSSCPFDVNVDGERIRVTAVTGISPIQTMMLQRSINGVIKTHTAGATIRLWDTPRFAY